MLLTPLRAIRHAAFIVLLRYNARRNRAFCGCSNVMIELLDGQHPAGCTHDWREPAEPLPPHQVEGVVMPVAGMTSPDLEIRWCDLTMPGVGLMIGRNWPDHGLSGTAMKFPASTGWHWWVSPIEPSSEEEEIGAGVAGTVEEAIKQVQDFVDEEIANGNLLNRLRRVAT